MKYLVTAAVAVICLLGVPKKHKHVEDGPVIVTQSAIHPTNCLDNDPLMPVCTLSHLVIENRNLKPVVATILCGEDEAEINLSPRTRLVVDIEETLYVPDMKCEIKHWEVK